MRPWLDDIGAQLKTMRPYTQWQVLSVRLSWQHSKCLKLSCCTVGLLISKSKGLCVSLNDNMALFSPCCKHNGAWQWCPRWVGGEVSRTNGSISCICPATIWALGMGWTWSHYLLEGICYQICMCRTRNARPWLCFLWQLSYVFPFEPPAACLSWQQTVSHCRAIACVIGWKFAKRQLAEILWKGEFKFDENLILLSPKF